MSEQSKKCLVISGEKYDVGKFEHPGEGICGIYLHDFYGKDVSKEFDHHHNTDDPFEMLQEAREKGECDGIKYVGKSEN